MSQKEMLTKVNSTSDIIIASIKELNKDKINKDKIKKLKEEENRKRKAQRQLEIDKKIFEDLDKLEHNYHKISYIKKRINLQKEYLSAINGRKAFAEKLQQVIHVLNRKNTKKIQEKEYKVDSREVLKGVINYIKDNKKIFNEWSCDVKEGIKKSKVILKDLRIKEKANVREELHG